MVFSCIYLIKSIAKPERVYVGSAVDFKNRKKKHLNDFNNNKHHSKKMQYHVNKYGIDDIYFEIVETIADKDQLLKREQFFIDLFNPFFNVCKVAGSRLGNYATDEAKLNMSKAQKGRKHSDKTKEKLRLANIGKKLPEETKLKIKLGQIGKRTNKGFKQTDEAKRKISEFQKGRKPSEQTVLKLKSSQSIRHKESRDRKTLNCPTCKKDFFAEKLCKSRIVTFCSRICHTNRDKTIVQAHN